jgi:hypothetical protein
MIEHIISEFTQGFIEYRTEKMQGREANESIIDILFGHGLISMIGEVADESITDEDYTFADSLLQKLHGKQIIQKCEINRLESYLEENRIQVFSLRGHGLTGEIYPDVFPRFSSDIDIIINEKSLPELDEYFYDEEYDKKEGNCDIGYTKDFIKFDISLKPSDVISISHIKGEEKTFGKMDELFSKMAENLSPSGIVYLPVEWEFLLNLLHYSYKHAFLRHIWGLDLILLANRMNTKNFDSLSTLIRESNAGIFLHHTIEKIRKYSGQEFPEPILKISKENYNHNFLTNLSLKSAGNKSSRTYEFLHCFLCSKSIIFRIKLLWKILFPPKGQLLRDGFENDGILCRLKYMINLPVRTLKLLKNKN